MALIGWLVALVACIVAGTALATAARHRRAAERLPEVERAVARAERRAEDLAAAESQLRRALDAIPQGVVIGDRSGTVVYNNAAATDFIAARHGEALVEAAIRELLAEAIAGRPAERTLELYGPPRRVLAVTAAPLPGANGGLIVVDDVSERRALESVRRDFVANISHELKTPVGALGLLAETLKDEDDLDIAHRLAGRMVNEAFRVAHTIDDLLELSRIEGGDDRIQEAIAVDAAMAEAADRIRPAAELREIAVEVVPPSRRLTIVGDRRQLVSALSNLLDNAVKYSEPGSTATLRARTGTAADGSLLVELLVEDQGLGIPPKDLDRIFERFYRVDQARSRNTGGTGLGLAIVRHVVANHDGEVTVESREGEGSTFILRFPAGPGPIPVTDRAPTDHSAGAEAEAG